MRILKDEPPPKKNREKRITDEMRDLKSGQSVVLDLKTAYALSAHFRYVGKESRRASVGENKVQVWVI